MQAASGQAQAQPRTRGGSWPEGSRDFLGRRSWAHRSTEAGLWLHWPRVATGWHGAAATAAGASRSGWVAQSRADFSRPACEGGRQGQRMLTADCCLQNPALRGCPRPPLPRGKATWFTDVPEPTVPGVRGWQQAHRTEECGRGPTDAGGPAAPGLPRGAVQSPLTAGRVLAGALASTRKLILAAYRMVGETS